MSQLKIGDYVIFEHGNSQLTGLVKKIHQSPDSTKFEVVPNAIGIDGTLIIESDKIMKANAKL